MSSSATYNGKYADGSKSYGGYATYHRAPASFVFKIPDAIDSADAAPMLCGGELDLVFNVFRSHSFI